MPLASPFVKLMREWVLDAIGMTNSTMSSRFRRIAPNTPRALTIHRGTRWT